MHCCDPGQVKEQIDFFCNPKWKLVPGEAGETSQRPPLGLAHQIIERPPNGSAPLPQQEMLGPPAALLRGRVVLAPVCPVFIPSGALVPGKIHVVFRDRLSHKTGTQTPCNPNRATPPIHARPRRSSNKIMRWAPIPTASADVQRDSNYLVIFGPT